MDFKYNDFELLYLISEGEDFAFEILCDKYKYLIIQRIRDYRIKSKYFDDYLQEGFLVLITAMKTYDSYVFRKTFNKYFDLLLQRRFQRLLKNESNFFYNVILMEYPELIEDEEGVGESLFVREEPLDFNQDIFSDIEKEVSKYLANGLKPREIASELKCDVKKIYNAIDRIKIKFRKNEKININHRRKI